MSDLALVCGGSGVLGSTLVEAFVARGDRVVVADRVAEADDGEGVMRRAVDLTSPDAVEALWDGLDERPRWAARCCVLGRLDSAAIGGSLRLAPHSAIAPTRHTSSRGSF